jgi:hypothetical protein
MIAIELRTTCSRSLSPRLPLVGRESRILARVTRPRTTSLECLAGPGTSPYAIEDVQSLGSSMEIPTSAAFLALAIAASSTPGRFYGLLRDNVVPLLT